MAELTDAALARGRAIRANEPWAAAARYDSASGRIVVDLENGCTFAFPPRLAEGLAEASEAQLAAVELLDNGHGLHRQDLDVDLSPPCLMAGIFGASTWMARQARRPLEPANGEE